MYLAKSIRAFPDQGGAGKMMRDAGFTDVTWKNYTGGIAAVHVAKKPGSGRPCSIRGGGCGALSEEERERYRAVYCGLCLAARPVRAAVAGVSDLRPHLLRAAVQLPARACRRRRAQAIA